jgi:hybrid polyketide synthase / nonribosomal peptide synthetase ACE1
MKEPIAIIGSGCRFPGDADSPSKLWEILSKPCDLLKKIDRFNTEGFYHPNGHHYGTANVQHAYLLDEDYRLFDAGFFGIKPVEAESIDPLQRILLETVYESLENAGLPLERLQDSDTAFYVGVMATDYTDILMRDVDTFP